MLNHLDNVLDPEKNDKNPESSSYDPMILSGNTTEYLRYKTISHIQKIMSKIVDIYKIQQL